MATRNLSRKYFELRTGAKANRHLAVTSTGSDEECDTISNDGLLPVNRRGLSDSLLEVIFTYTILIHIALSPIHSHSF